MDNKFVDRKNIKSVFLKDIREFKSRNKVVLLMADQGIGKSALTRTISADLESHLIFRVSSRYSSSRETPLGAHYKAFVDEAVRLREEGKLPSALDYLKTKPKETMMKLSVSAVKAASKLDPFTKKLANLAESLVGLTDRDLGKLFLSSSIEAQLQFRSYVVDSIKTSPVLIIVENAQSMDSNFLDFIRTVFESSTSTYCILEYTTNVKAKEEPEDLIEEFSDVVTASECLELEKLPTNYALEIVSSRDSESLAVIAHYYEESGGNLKPLQQMANYRAAALSSALKSISLSKYGIESVTIDEFKSLSSAEKFILALIITCDRDLAIHDLRLALEQSDELNIDTSLLSCIDNLESKEFIQLSNGVISTSDDVSFRVIDGQDFLGKFEVLALRAWRNLYQHSSVELSNISKKEITLRHLRVLCRLDDKAGLVRLLPEVLNQAKSSFSPLVFLRPLVDWLLEETPSVAWHLAVEKVLNSTVEFGLYEISKEILDQVALTEFWALEDDLKLSLVLLKLDRPEDAIRNILKVHQTKAPKLDEPNNILFSLICLTAHYYLSQFDKALKIHNDIESKLKIERTQSYAFFLRSSSLFNSHTKSIPDLKEAASIFDEHNMPLALARTNTQLSIELARIGNLDASQNRFDEACSVLEGRNTDHNIVVNNRAAIQLQKGRINESIFSELEDLLLVYKGPYDIAVIANNLMLAATLNKNEIKAKSYAKKVHRILNSSSNLDAGISWTVEKNMHFVESSFDLKLGELTDKIPEYQLSNLPKHKLFSIIDSGRKHKMLDQNAYFVGMSFRPMFLAYWAIEF